MQDEISELLLSLNPSELSVIINLEDVRDKVLKMKQDKVLQQHPYQITKSPSDNRWRTYIILNGKRKMIVKSSRESLEDVLLNHYSIVSSKPITLDLLYPDWHSYKSTKVSSTTMCTIDSYWDKYYKSTSIITIPINKLDYITLDMWAHDIVSKYYLTSKQYGNMSLIMRQLLDFAIEKEIISKSPFSRVKIDGRRFCHTPKKDASKEVFLIGEQPLIIQEALLDSQATGTSLPLAIPLAFQTGLRIGVILGLKFSDINGDFLCIQRMEVEDRVKINGKWHCNGYKIVEHTKTKAGNREVILTPIAKDYLAQAKHYNNRNGYYDDDFIFVNENGRVHFKAIDCRVKKYCRKAGIPEKSIHKIRKTYISSLIDANLNIDQIRRLVGHEAEQTTYHNYCFNRLSNEQTIELVTKALK